MLLFILKNKLYSNFNVRYILGGDADVIEHIIVNRYEFGLEINMGGIFLECCKGGYTRLANIICWTCNVGDVYNLFEDGILLATMHGYLDIVKLILSYDSLAINGNNVNVIFGKACENGSIEIAKWLDDNFNINLGYCSDYALRWSCYNGHIDIVKWLWSICKIDKDTDNSVLFMNSCISGNVELISWLWDTDNTIDILGYSNINFKNACRYGRFEIAKWIYSKKADILDSSIDWNFLFNSVCGGGHVEIVKWLYSIRPDIDISYFGNKAFLICCENGSMELVKWLYNLENRNLMLYEAFFISCRSGFHNIAQWLISMNVFKPDNSLIQKSFIGSCKHLETCRWLYSLAERLKYIIDIHEDGEYPFVTACENGDIEFAKWLYSVDGDIDIRVNNDYPFIISCKNGFIELATWLATMCRSYYMEVDNGQIVHFRTNNEMFEALECIDCDYDRALKLVGIDKKIDRDREICIVCRESLDRMVETECRHLYCLRCLLNWLTIKNMSKDFICAYCRRIFNWDGCKDVLSK